ncbi:amidohydrolase (plasmid) [Bartonella sp. HY329]|uniref:amidohydrolase n=1 Tax=unclassified Bartonella TaxID=2645622 RepID=UPI0021CA7414|nr:MULTISPECIES: amidohydrolase [unclassified Bartonella]UXM96578.1 amidohydrolase [Bartonella sp. HY329]UXN10901.1 amidohydrolase [Bartonella sp. HY328]
MQISFIIKNAKILTMDPQNPFAEAVAIANETIFAVGSNEEITKLAQSDTKIIDAQNHTLLPGFVESHLHFVLGGLELTHLHLSKVHGFDALQHAVRDYAQNHMDEKLLIGYGVAYDIIDRPLTRHDLDAILDDRPFALMSCDHHTVWANTAALRQAGLFDDKHGARDAGVVVDDKGEATGELLEFDAFGPVMALGGEAHLQLAIATGGEPVPLPDAETREADKKKILAGLNYCASFGITSAVNMDGNRYTLDLCQELYDEGRLPVRVVVPFHFKPQMPLSELDRASAMHRDFASKWVKSGFVKMFMDGVAESRTAYMLEDYPDTVGERGTPLFELERFNEICTEIDKRGLQIAVHAIGDGAVRAVIDGYEAASKANGKRDARHRIEHIELINRDDIPRMAKLDIIASIQPAHVLGALDFSDHGMEKVFSTDRWKDNFLCRTLRDNGIKIAFSSDWSVADVNVARNLQAHLARKPFKGAGDERISRADTLLAYTSGSAYTVFWEDFTGMVKQGMAADLVLYQADIDDYPAEKLGELKVALTIAGGKITYQADQPVLTS